MLSQAKTNSAVKDYPFSHDFLDLYQLVCAKRTAQMLFFSPEKVLAEAKSNLERWISSDTFGAGELKTLNEWKTILEDSDVREISKILTEDSEKGRRLRQSSPFVGILSKEELRKIREDCEKETTS